MDWDSLWGQAKEAVQNGLDQAKAVGVPAIQATAEQWLLNTVQEQHKETTAQLNAAVKEAQSSPSGPVGSAFSQVLSSTAVTQYGGMMIFGVAAIAVGGYLLLRK